MNTYTAYLRTDANFAMQDIEADPELALAEARKIADTRADAPWYLPYDGRRPINEIAIEDDDHDEVALFQDEHLSLRLAAADLLSAAEKILDRWQNGDLGEVIPELAVAVSAAKGGGA
jgi:hypothetical protein